MKFIYFPHDIDLPLREVEHIGEVFSRRIELDKEHIAWAQDYYDGPQDQPNARLSEMATDLLGEVTHIHGDAVVACQDVAAQICLLADIVVRTRSERFEETEKFLRGLHEKMLKLMPEGLLNPEIEAWGLVQFDIEDVLQKIFESAPPVELPLEEMVKMAPDAPIEDKTI